MTIYTHLGDLPDDVDLGPEIAIDSETMGLIPHRDRLCLIQLSSGNGDAHLVKFDGKSYNAPNLCRQLADPDRLKIFHFGRFDIAVIEQYLGVTCAPVYCTKIGSRLGRTFTDRHSLKYRCHALLGVDISTQQPSSDGGAAERTDAQKEYAASDVLYLHRLKAKLDAMLAREGRTDLARRCFDFLPTRARLDLDGWPEIDIFSHS